MCSPSLGAGSGVAEPNSSAASARVHTGPTQTSSLSKTWSHSANGTLHEDRRQFRREPVLIVAVLPFRKLRPADDLAQAREELRLERADREVSCVRGLVHAVAGEPAGEEPRDGLAAEPVRDEIVRAVRHRDDEPRAHARARSLHERCEDLHDRTEGARREIGDLHRRPDRRRVLEDPGPAEVVEVVAGTLRVPVRKTETGDRAVHHAFRDVLRSDPEPGRDPRPEALEDDVRAAGKRLRERGLRLQVADDRLRARAKRRVPSRRRLTHRIAVRSLDVNDLRAQPEQLTARVRAREVAREVDHQDPCKRLQAE